MKTFISALLMINFIDIMTKIVMKVFSFSVCKYAVKILPSRPNGFYPNLIDDIVIQVVQWQLCMTFINKWCLCHFWWHKHHAGYLSCKYPAFNQHLTSSMDIVVDRSIYSCLKALWVKRSLKLRYIERHSWSG